MEQNVTAFVSRTRDINMFGELSHGHRVLLDNAAEQRDGHFYEFMSCTIVAAFKFEAFLNHIGTRLFPFWTQLEHLPHRNKLATIASQLNVDIDFGVRPFQTLTDLFKARDQLAHGKPDTVKQSGVLETGTREEMRRRKPLMKWELNCTIEFAERAYADTEEVADFLWAAAGFNPHDLRSCGSSYTISSLAE